MSIYQGIVLDLDKTLVANGSDEVEPSVIERVEILQDRGLHVIPATGRAYSYAKDLLARLGVRHAIVDNGARIISDEFSSVWSAEIDGEDLLWLADLAEYIGTELCVPDDNRQMRDRSTFVEGAFSAWLLGLDEASACKAMDELAAKTDISAYLSESWKGIDLVDINISNTRACKQAAIHAILECLGVSPENMIGIGDGVNDIGFVSCLGFGIAMADGHPELVSMAHTTVPPQSQGGFLNALSIFDCPIISV